VLVIIAVGAAGYLVWSRSYTQGSNNSYTPAPTVSMATACGHLTLSKGSSDGTAGTIYWHAVITNAGAYACKLAGYPAAFMTDAGSISLAAASNSLYAPATVTLAAHGGKAHAVIGLPDPGAFDPGSVTCTAAASSNLKLYLPGVTTPLQTVFGESACPGFSVTALQPGA
ncbi:MAG TPA: DUF4232 domain-containing protein, partial [Candidatus Saccharimonadales bacterium]|nr:DUF4232 domain-containing protein [Candidatus Saccharimonadales bacterium]